MNPEFSTNGAELRKIQKKLVDTIISKPQELEKIINIQLAGRKGFHQYTLHNIALANWQLYIRTGETCELLAPYKKWQKIKLEDGSIIHRNVKKGEKALRILAPIPYTFKVKNEETGEEEVKSGLRFKSVPVFDLSQTEGDAFETDFTNAKYDYALEEIISRSDVPVNLSKKEITRGYTNGEKIWISQNISTNRQICTYFHELAHYLLHFKDGERVSRDTAELEAEAVAYLVSCYLGIENEESPAYILAWTKNYDEDKRTELLKGKGSNVLKTAQKIINDLKLPELINTKTTIPSTNKWEINWVGVKE